MNPLQWTREHQIAWVVVSAFGAAFGLLLAYIHSPYFSLSHQVTTDVPWRTWLVADWQWGVDGFLMTAIAFYAAQLLRRAA